MELSTTRIKRCAQVVCSACLCLIALLFGRIAPAAELTAVPSRQTVFAIPFQVNRAASAEDAPVEVQLFVHTDDSPQWEHHKSAKPDAGSFEFSAPADGHYWFSVRSVDKRGNPHPGGPMQPGLRVCVDTQPPHLDLTGSWNPDGDVVLQWHATDAQIVASSLKLAYREGPTADWQQFVIDAQAPPNNGTECRGESRWWPDTDAEMIHVRGEVFDEAGNSTVRHLPLTRSGKFVQQRGDGEQSLLDRQTDSAALESLQFPASSTLPASESETAGSQQEWTPTQVSTQPLEAAPNLGRQAPLNPTSEQSVTPSADRGAWVVPPPATTSSAANAAATTPAVQPPAGSTYHSVNSLRVELQYALDGLEPLDVARVEVWGTVDGGQQWKSYGVDGDGRSPILVDVDDDGTYGFRISVTTHRGVTATRPAAGEPPQIWVVVDTARPVATLVARPVATQGSARTAMLEWTAEDRELAEQPIRLSYSGFPGGPWTTIQHGLINTGAYRWNVDPQVPAQVYLRLEVTDRAGNMAVVQTPQPIPLDLGRVEARLQHARGTGQDTVAPAER